MTMTDTDAVIDVDSLDAEAVDVRPRTVDWSTGYADAWEYWDASTCDDCGAVVVVTAGSEECECGADVYAEGPMMNYLYPIGIADPEDAARRLAGLPVCVIVPAYDGDDSLEGLALTGGGMDLSWEICEAFMRLGHLPPLHFCDLPAMADKYDTPETRAILDAARASCVVARRRVMMTAERIDRTRETLRPVE